jgi:hypothetical protein
MSKSSIAEAIVAWEKVLLNVKANAADAPGIDGYVAPLEKILDDAKNLSASLEARKAAKQQESKDRKVLMQMGNVQVSRIRSSLKAFFGPHSERIIEFGGRPVRPRKNKVPVVPETPPAAPKTPAPEAAPKPGAGTPAASAPVGVNEAPRNPTTL